MLGRTSTSASKALETRRSFAALQYGNDEKSETAAGFSEGVDSVRKPYFFTATVAKVGLARLVLALVISPVPQALGETSDPSSEPVYALTGHVRVFHAGPPETLEDGSGVVVWLVPTQATQKRRPNTERPHYQIVQQHKMFDPHLLVVPAGSVVEFPNHDPYFHNVFSLSRSKRFDLGLYEAGVLKAVRFDRAGVSYLFCNIHPEMMATVLTVDSMYFGISDKTGRISIGNVPPGEYILHVWHENATPQALEAMQRAIFVGDDSRALPAISMALSRRIQTAGKNQQQRSTTFLGANWSGR